MIIKNRNNNDRHIHCVKESFGIELAGKSDHLTFVNEEDRLKYSNGVNTERCKE